MKRKPLSQVDRRDWQEIEERIKRIPEKHPPVRSRTEDTSHFEEMKKLARQRGNEPDKMPMPEIRRW